MNSDFYSPNNQVQTVNNQIAPIASYTPKLQVIAGNAYQFVGGWNTELRLTKAEASVDDIVFGRLTPNSNERKHFQVGSRTYSFTPQIYGTKFNVSGLQPDANRNEAMVESVAKGMSKASISYDKALLNGTEINTGILTTGNYTANPSTKITSISELISVLENMKMQLSELNMSTTGFKTLLPISLRPMIEAGMTFTVFDSNRVYRSIGQEGVDFDYIPTFVDSTPQIIMSYAPQVLWIYTYVPQVLGQYVEREGSVENTQTFELGYGSTAIFSTNQANALLVQPYTTA